MPNAKMSSSRYQHSIKQDAHPFIVTSLLRFASLSSSADAACAMRNTHEQFTVRLPGCVSMNSSLARVLSSSLSHKRGRGGKPNFRAYLGWYRIEVVVVVVAVEYDTFRPLRIAGRFDDNLQNQLYFRAYFFKNCNCQHTTQ